MDGCARGSLLVGRRRDASTLELLRVDGCKVASRALLTTAGDERAALALLGGSAAPPPARRPRSRTWIWGVAIAAALVAAAAAVIGALAARPTSEVLDVAPHL
jgi:hypothetical protein